MSAGQQLDKSALPQHLGIIMDGNGRWAKKRGLPRSAGHTAGANNFRTITRYCSRIGIPYLTVYAFSTENWRRPAEEVGALMRLFKQYLEEALRDFMDENIRVIFIGDTSAFSPELRELIARVERESSGEHRTSNFLLWQSAYAEYVVMDILWPDFKTSDLDRALLEYASRNRRFGGV